MALLRPAAFVLALGFAVVLSGIAECQAGTIPYLLETFEITGSAAAGPGSNYEAGGQTAFHFGDADDLSNRTAEAHFNYTEDYTPSDPFDVTSPIKQTYNWGGGYKIDVWQGGSLGFDLDSLQDNFENLSSNGQRITLGVDPFKLSYRFARSRINTTFVEGTPPVTLQGALIYQHTVELDYNWLLSDSSYFAFDGAVSFFEPSASAFGNLLAIPRLISLSNFQDTLESFEQWRFGGEWTMLWTPVIDTAASAHLSRLIITGNDLLDTNIALGYQLSRQWHVQAGWEYMYLPEDIQSLYSVGLRFSWDRAAYEVRASETSGTPGNMSPIEKSQPFRPSN